MSRTPIPFCCATCGGTFDQLKESIALFGLVLEDVRKAPWQDFEFEFVCDCGDRLESEEFFSFAWSNPALHSEVLEFAVAHLDVFRDDSWSYGGWILPTTQQLVSLNSADFEVYLRIIRKTDVDHAHDDFHAIHEVLQELRDLGDARAKTVEAILRGFGSQIVDELLGTPDPAT